MKSKKAPKRRPGPFIEERHFAQMDRLLSMARKHRAVHVRYRDFEASLDVTGRPEADAIGFATVGRSYEEDED